MCVCEEGLTAILSLLSSQLGPRDAQARLPLPFALHPPRFHRGLCLGFPVEQALDRRAAGDVEVWEPLFFSS